MDSFIITPLAGLNVTTVEQLAWALDQRIQELNTKLMPLFESGDRLVVSRTATTGGTYGIGSDGILDFSITEQKLADSAISTRTILDSAISELKMANEAVTEAKIAANAVSNTKIIAGSIQSDRIAAGTIQGDRIAATTITGSNIAGLTITGANIAATTITADKMTISQLSAITADMGAITAGTIVLPSGGLIRSGQTTYNTGTGFWLGNVSGTPKFSIGSSTNGLTWDGSVLAVTGTLTSTIGTIGGFTLSSSSLTGGSSTSTITINTSAVSGISMGNFSTNTQAAVYSRGGVDVYEGAQIIAFLATTGVAGSRSGFLELINGPTSTPMVILSASTGFISASGTITGGLFSGSGASLTTLNASNISSGTLSNSRLSGVLLAANNLSDVTAATARSNLGVTGTGGDTTYAFRSNNLSDLTNAGTARTNLGLGSSATLNATGGSGSKVLRVGAYQAGSLGGSSNYLQVQDENGVSINILCQ
jgi:hypothetical protein